MHPQNYSSEEAYERWRQAGLRHHLEQMRRNYRWARLTVPVARDIHPSDRGVTPFQHWYTTRFGIVTWGVFARAFWAIYERGSSPLFYGSVILSCATLDENSPALFEVAQEVRTLMDSEVDTNGIEDFANIIRDDYAMQMRVPVSEKVAFERGYFLQSVGIFRSRLPQGYLHHRLVPIVTHPRFPYATILDHRYWGAEFKRIWQTGAPLLSDEQLKHYHRSWPEIRP